MRYLFLLSFLFALAGATFAQPELHGELNTLPEWMQRLITAEKPQRCILPKRAPLHTNAFIGTWSIQKKGGYRYEFWSDRHRVVVQEFDQKGKRRRSIYIDLAANVRMSVGTSEEYNVFSVEDLRIPQAGYFREIWSDSVRATGAKEDILGALCKELLGIDGNKDSTYYWSTDQHSILFSDLLVWAQWLCREGDLKYLSALSDRSAGGSLRVDWPKRRFGPEAGSIAFLSVDPGATPMPVLEPKQYKLFERRFLWMQNSGLGRLPDWMRGCLTTLKPHPLPLAYTPKPADRAIPDNAFIGILTAETPTRYVNGKDTTIRMAKYSYWADARRAVLTLDDPGDNGTVIYMVDLDADVAIIATNEGHSYVIPKLYIGSLDKAGLVEFGRGVELAFTPTEHRRKILGQSCELHTATGFRYLTHFWFSDEKLNPIFDMARWMEPRPSQKFKDLMFFGVADMPMPFAVMGTYLTSFKPGKAKPPVLDLSNYSIRDQRLRERRERDRPHVEEDRVIERSVTYDRMEMELGPDVPVEMPERMQMMPPPTPPPGPPR